jgi:hypothetical protein
VAALGFTFKEFRLDNAGSAIAGAFEASAKELLSFNPIKEGTGFELQDTASCVAAWRKLNDTLYNMSDICGTIGLVIKGLKDPNWTDGAVAHYIHNFCANDGGACIIKYRMAYQNMLTQCGGFTPYVVATTFGNQTDQLTRTLKALVSVACLNSTDPYNATNYTDPVFGTPGDPFPYPLTYCWLHFRWLLNIDLMTVDDALLQMRCTDCAKNVTDWLIKNGVNALALAARQARAFCDQKHDPVSGALVYCAPKLKALQIAASDPAFMDTVKTDTDAGRQAIATFCHPCVKWGMQLAREIQDLIEMYAPGSVPQATRDQLVQSANGLSVTCVKDLRGKYCVNLLAKYNITTLTNRFKPCIPYGCTAKTPLCLPTINAFYRETGCCLSVFLRSLKYAQGDAAAAAAIVPDILRSCNYNDADLPMTCAQKKVKVHLPLANIAHSFIMSVPKEKLLRWFTASLGVSDDAIPVNGIVCQQSPTDNSTICDVTIFPDDTDSATTYVADFGTNVQMGTQQLAEFDIAPLDMDANAGGPRINQDLDAYQSATFTATVEDQCLSAKPPANATLINGTCVLTCENKMKDIDETDVDCGGVGCARCSNGMMCNTDDDCASAHCGVSDSKKKCGGNGAGALLANPLLLLVGAFLALFLL